MIYYFVYSSVCFTQYGFHVYYLHYYTRDSCLCDGVSITSVLCRLREACPCIIVYLYCNVLYHYTTRIILRRYNYKERVHVIYIAHC